MNENAVKIHQKVTSIRKNRGTINRRLTKSADDGAVRDAVSGAAIGAGAAGAGAAAKVRRGANNVKLIATGRGALVPKDKIRALAARSLKRAVPKALGAAAAGGLAGMAYHKLTKKAGYEGTIRYTIPTANVAGDPARARRAKEAFEYYRKSPRNRMAALASAAREKLVPVAGKALKRAAIPAAIIGGAVAVHRKNESMKKQAADAITHKGKTYREGTVGSAAAKMGAAGIFLGAPNPRHILSRSAKAALLGAGYGTLRGLNRIRKGEISLTTKEFRGKKHRLYKKAADMIEHNGRKYREGTVGSAAKKMALTGGALSLASSLAGSRLMKQVGGGGASGALHVASALRGAIQGGALGAGYGAIRGALRHGRGEESATPADFRKMKESK